MQNRQQMFIIMVEFEREEEHSPVQCTVIAVNAICSELSLAVILMGLSNEAALPAYTYWMEREG